MQQEGRGEDPVQGERGSSTWGETESGNWGERLMGRGRGRENPPGFLKHRMQAPFGEVALGGNANSTARASANVKRP